MRFFNKCVYTKALGRFIKNAAMLSLLFLALSGFGQAVSEQLLVQTDRPAYISGETVWLSLTNMRLEQTAVSTFSKVAYVDMQDGNGQSIAQAKIHLEEGRGLGNLELAAALRTGLYTIRAHTQSMLNFENPAFYEQEVFVLNPQEPLILPAIDQVSDFQIKQTRRPVSNQEAITIEINSNTSSLAQRTLCTLNITAKDQAGNPIAADLALSVARKAPEPNSLLKKADNYPSIATELAEVQIPTENRGMRLSGKVLNEQTQQGEPNVEVFIAFPGKRSITYTAITNSQGQFSTILPKLYGLKQVVIQITEKEGPPLKVSIDDHFLSASEKKNTPIKLSANWLSYLEELMINTQVGQAYEAFQSPARFQVEMPYDGISFFGRPEKQYLLDDYTRFPIPEFFFEIVPEVRVRGKFGEERISIVSELGNNNIGVPPLMLVDGVPVFDQDAFLKINNKLIESVEIITDPIWLNPSFFNGMIQLSSFEGDARSFDLPATALRQSFLTYLPEKQFDAPSYEQDAKTSTLPDFRNTLYWNPQITTDKNGQATIQFYTSDALGSYEAKVFGVSPNGQLGEASIVIEVEKK